MTLVFVHGMRQEGKDPRKLQLEWQAALHAAWQREGLAIPTDDVVMPFYGDVLDQLTRAARQAAKGAVAHGAGAAQVSELEEQWIRGIAKHEGITDAEVREELGQEVVTRGFGNAEWVQALARVVERRVPTAGRLGLSFVHQVDTYLRLPHARKAVDDLVRPALEGPRRVVVSHSLGTIVTYTLLRGAKIKPDVPLLVTLGSPLGIDAVKQHIRPPRLSVPGGVARWLNGTDERDYVALHAQLVRETFTDGIENIADIHNRPEDAHSIEDYLGDARICRRIHAALTA